MRNIFFIAIGLFVCLSACRSSRQVVQQATTDSTTVTFREVEKIVHLEGDSVKTSMQVQLNKEVKDGMDNEALEFVPQTQTIETKRTSVKIELTKTGEIKATAISKELNEKVTVPEKTISKYKSEKTEYYVKEKPVKHFFTSVWKWVKGILFSLVLLSIAGIVYKFGKPVITIIKNLLKL
jgi:hypothetical protein